MTFMPVTLSLFMCRDAIFNLERSLTLIGPEITRGCIILTFFEKREQRSFFGLLSNQVHLGFDMSCSKNSFYLYNRYVTNLKGENVLRTMENSRGC